MEKRVDIEESNNLADKMPERVEAMSKELFRRLDAMNASYPISTLFTRVPLMERPNLCSGETGSRKTKYGLSLRKMEVRSKKLKFSTP